MICWRCKACEWECVLYSEIDEGPDRCPWDLARIPEWEAD